MLLFLILIQGALGVTVHSNTETFGSEYSKIVRIDRVGPDPKSHIKVAKFMEPLDSMLVPEKFLLAPTNAFSINLTCEEYGVEATVCDKARATLASAASRIAQELAISTQITVTARFRPFCSNNINCQNSKRLGSARHASSFVVKQDGQHFTYNQALVKQLGTRVKVQYSATDILADFNSQVDWLFVNDQEDESKIDFEFVAAHELTHGLGFGGSFVHYTEIFPNAQPGYIAPLMLIVNDSDFSSTTMVNVVEPCSIFDSYLYTRRGFSFKRLSAAISSFGNRRLPVFKFLEEFETSGMPFRASQFAYNVSKMGERSLFFHTIDDKRIPLYTPTDFLQGSSISHIELLNANTNNFLMIPSVGRGITLEQLISQSDTHSLYGDRLLSMMESIGWPTIRNSVPRDIQLQVRYPEDVKFQIFSDPFSPVEVAANAANCGFFTFWTLLSLYILI